MRAIEGWVRVPGFVLLAAGSAWADPLTLEEALARAREGSPRLEAAAERSREAGAEATRAGKMPNPELDLRVWQLEEQNGMADVVRRRMILSQDLELGRRGPRARIAAVERELAEAARAALAAEVDAEVETRFAEALGAQQTRDAADAWVGFLEGARAKVAALVDSGSIGRVELPQLVRRLGLARVARHEAEAERAAAALRLAGIWGARPDFDSLTGTLAGPGPLPGLDAVLARAARSPARRAADLERARREAALDLARAERIPDLKLGAGVRWIDDVDPDYMLDLEIELPIFDAGGAAVAAARSGLAAADADRRRVDAEATAEAAVLYHEWEAAAERVRVYERDVLPAAREVFDAYRQAFEANPAGADDLLDARRDLYRAEADAIDARVELARARAALARATGS